MYEAKQGTLCTIQENMIEDILENYRRLCTRVGQFDIVLNFGLILLVIFGFGGILGLFVFIKLDNYVNDIIRIYLSMGTLFLVEFIYLFIVEFYIFKREKKYIIKTLNLLIKKELDKSIKEKANRTIIDIKNINFRQKWLSKSNIIEKIYNEIKFKEFLEMSQINNLEKAKHSIEMIDKFLNDKNYFKEYIDIAFFGILAIAVLNPIIEYTQSIFIPNNATEFSWGNILLFFLSILPFIVLPLFTNHIMHKINYSKSIQNKKLLFKLIEKLSDYNFDYNELNRYINFKINPLLQRGHKNSLNH